MTKTNEKKVITKTMTGVKMITMGLLLPSNWVVIDDVVLEPKPDEFAQISVERR